MQEEKKIVNYLPLLNRNVITRACGALILAPYLREKHFIVKTSPDATGLKHSQTLSVVLEHNDLQLLMVFAAVITVSLDHRYTV